MNYKELMCGNFVFDLVTATASVVMLVSKEIVWLNTRSAKLDEIAPIVIDENWIIKLGFKQLVNDPENVLRVFFLEAESGDVNFFITFEEDYIALCFAEKKSPVGELTLLKKVKYVHEIQNTIRVIGNT